MNEITKDIYYMLNAQHNKFHGQIYTELRGEVVTKPTIEILNIISVRLNRLVSNQIKRKIRLK